MKRFLRQQLQEFLEAIDSALDDPVKVVVIGGSAAALHYGVAAATRDIDTWTNVGQALATAAELARKATGLDVPLQRSAVADAPVDLESRLERVLPHLARLEVLVPERHDLVLMKAVRCYEHDLAAIVEIHGYAPLDLALLVQRFRDEMTPIGEPGRIRRNFLVVVETLFPERVDQVERELRRSR
jgi:hypothetical protein